MKERANGTDQPQKPLATSPEAIAWSTYNPGHLGDSAPLRKPHSVGSLLLALTHPPTRGKLQAYLKPINSQLEFLPLF